MLIYHVPLTPRRRSLNIDAGQVCQGQALPAWLGGLPREHRQDTHVFVTGQQWLCQQPQQ